MMAATRTRRTRTRREPACVHRDARIADADQSFSTLQQITHPRYCGIAVKRSRSNWRVSYWFWVIPMNTVLQHRRVTDPCFRCALEKTSGRLPREYSRPVPRLLRGLHPRARCARFAACVLSALSLPCETPVQPMLGPRPPTTLLPQALRDADERDPHFRPRRPCSHLRRARSDQDDQPAGRAGASRGLCCKRA